jgi:hypothetical protein
MEEQHDQCSDAPQPLQRRNEIADAGLLRVAGGFAGTRSVLRQPRRRYANGILTSGLRPSQSGTGSFFDRRNSGLNSFDW